MVSPWPPRDFHKTWPVRSHARRPRGIPGPVATKGPCADQNYNMGQGNTEDAPGDAASNHPGFVLPVPATEFRGGGLSKSVGGMLRSNKRSSTKPFFTASEILLF